MKLVVLSDNRQQTNAFETEHGLCVYLQTERYKCLLDVGASGLFIRNAEIMGIDLSDVDYVFLSHGHADHMGGLPEFLKINQKAKIVLSAKIPGSTFYSIRNGLRNITTDINFDLFTDRFIFVDTPEMFFEDEIRVFRVMTHPFPQPKANASLYKDIGDGLMPDDFNHELVVSFGSDYKLIYTGCAHNGLLNILNSRKLLCLENITHVFGGFHLVDSRDGQVYETLEEIDFIAKEIMLRYPKINFLTGHCTGDNVFQTMKLTMNDHLNSFYTGYSIQI